MLQMDLNLILVFFESSTLGLGSLCSLFASLGVLTMAELRV